MTWSIRIYPLEYEAFVKALETHDTAYASEEEQTQAEAAKQVVFDIVDAMYSDGQAGALYDCSLVGHSAAETASLSINVYRKPAAAQPQPAATETEAEEAAVEETG